MSKKIKLLNLVGARPQFIKASALSRVISNSFQDSIEEVLVHSGQHYDTDMSEVFFQELALPHPMYNLGIGSMTNEEQVERIAASLEEVLKVEKPDVVVVYGDTNTTLGGAKAAARLSIPIAHIEAGLRSYNDNMPEEKNRKETDHLSRWLFCPTSLSVQNLIREGAQGEICEVGDIMMDVALNNRPTTSKRPDTISAIAENEEYVLFTLHRNFNTDDPKRLRSILEGVSRLSEKYPVVFPIHPRTASMLSKDLEKMLSQSRCVIIPPQGYRTTMALLSESILLITDSGGMQKEGYFYKKPVVLPRNETEWKEAVELGCAHLVDADPERLFTKSLELIQTPPVHFPNVYGDGKSSERIINAILSSLQS